MKKIVIIGNGISGITVARHIRKRSNHSITIISSESDYFFSRTALMYIYMGHMKYEHIKPYEDSFWEKNKLDLVRDRVEHIDVKNKHLNLTSGKSLAYDVLVLATGSKPNKLTWPGVNLSGVQGLYSIQDLENMKQSTSGIKKAVIVGGGLIGVEMAEMLRFRNIEVTMLVREKEFWNNVLPLKEANLISRHVRMHGVDLKLETELKEIRADEKGNVNAIVTDKGELIACQFVGITIGVIPQIDFLKDSQIETARGILVNEYLETNVPDVYAIGDCAERRNQLPGRKTIEQVWYTGRMMGEVLAQTICGERTKYEPGPWFNSAKFFDVEYQTYGHVGDSLKSNESEFYWEHTDGMKCMHFVWDKTTQEFLGINSFGIRLRHVCFDQWLRQKKSIQFVVENLEEANFDPEFFARYEEAIRNQMKREYPALFQNKVTA